MEKTIQRLYIALILVSAVAISAIGANIRHGNIAPQTIVVTSDAPAQVQYIPIVVTAVPEPDIPGDLWRCLQNPTLAQDAPDIGLDYHNYIVMGLDIQPIGEKGQINTYQVYNRARPDDGIKKVIVQWAVESDGHQTVGSCQVPVEWYPQYLGPTPYILPSEVPRQGEGVGEPES